jgi:hypothetical protein
MSFFGNTLSPSRNDTFLNLDSEILRTPKLFNLEIHGSLLYRKLLILRSDVGIL